MRTYRVRLPHVALLSAALVAVFAGPVLAAPASPCKGLEQTVCEGTADCTWTKGYTRKDGKAVAGYCKASAKRGAAAAAKPTVPATAPVGEVKVPPTPAAAARPATPAIPAAPVTPATPVSPGTAGAKTAK